jgi:hypothetical protein
MKKLLYFCFYLFYLNCSGQNQLRLDSNVYNVDITINENIHLQSVVKQLLSGYCEGKWNAYYPNFEYNSVLHHDFLAHYSAFYQKVGNNFCWQDYCNATFMNEFYSNFYSTVKVKEYLYYNQNQNIIKRDLAWIQLNFNFQGKIVPSVKFWFKELKNTVPIHVDYLNNNYSIQQIFDNILFIKKEYTVPKSNQIIENQDNIEQH